MTDERIDLSPLDPGRDPDRVDRIARAVRAGIEGRPAPEPWTAPLARAWKPALIAAAVAGLFAVAAPRLAGLSGARSGGADPLAISLGVPDPLAVWAAADDPPAAAEVLSALERPAP